MPTWRTIVDMQSAHWGARVLKRGLDESVGDPEHPQAVPASCPTDLMGRIRVRLRAEGGAIVAYGFGQRIEIPASEISAVRTVQVYRTRPGGMGRSQALLVFDKQG